MNTKNKKEEFNLSEKIAEHQNIDLNWIDVEDVKECYKRIEIRMLKKFKNASFPIMQIIREEFGEELSGAGK